MGYIQSSPWLDAANYGHGLGNTLAQILFQLPHMRRQEELDSRHLALQERQAASQEEVAKAHARYFGAQADYLPDKVEIEGAKIDAKQRQYEAKNLLDQTVLALKGKDVNSKVGLREKQGTFLDQRAELYPEEVAARVANLNASTGEHEATTFYKPFQLENYREHVNSEIFGRPLLDKIPRMPGGPSAEPAYPTGGPRPTISAQPPGIFNTHVGLRKQAGIRVRNRKTGQTGTAQSEADVTGDWEAIP